MPEMAETWQEGATPAVSAADVQAGVAATWIRLLVQT